MVEFEDWEPYYDQILRSFGYSKEKDERSAHILAECLPRPRLSGAELESMIMGKTVLIFGAHESVEAGISVVKNQNIQATLAPSLQKKARI